MEIDTSKIRSFLKDNFYPFSYFSEAALKKSVNAIRIIELRKGEKITLGGASELEDYLYLIKGCVSVEKGEKTYRTDADEIIDWPFLFPRLPEMLTISAIGDALICHADHEALEVILSFDELSSNAAFFEDENAEKILKAIRKTTTFHRLPMEALEEAVKRMRYLHATKGTEVIKQGEKGDSFYIIFSGKAEVWKQGLYDDEQKMVDTMGPGDAFGEESLVLGGSRNATVRLTSDAILLTMTQEDFNELISISMIQRVKPEIAKAMIESGYQLLDVRYEEEYEEKFVPGSILMPLPDLRKRWNELDLTKQYVVMCASGKRASVAALLLKQRKFEVTAIEGGMRDWPFETQKSMEIEIILFDFCPYGQRAIITLLYNQHPYRLTVIDPDNLPPWFEQVSPLGKVPILRVEGTETIFESSVINDYLNKIASDRLLPKNLLRRTQCRSWIEFGSACLSTFTGMLAAPTEAKFYQAQAAFLKNLHILEEQVNENGPYFEGEQFTLVDSTYAPLFVRMSQLFEVITFYDQDEFPRITSWGESLLALDAVKNSVIGDFAKVFRKFVHRKGKDGYIDTLMG
jgi:glutathione S-transferase